MPYARQAWREQAARRRARGTDHWRRLQAAARKRAGGPICEACGVHGTGRFQVGAKVELHHLTYERLGNELLADVALLCHDCHQRAHNATF